MSDPVLEAETLIGDDADKFVRSDLGRTILGIVEQEKEVAIAQLKTCDATDTKRVQQLQNEIWRTESFEGWLLELIRRGEAALRAIEFEESHE